MQLDHVNARWTSLNELRPHQRVSTCMVVRGSRPSPTISDISQEILSHKRLQPHLAPQLRKFPCTSFYKSVIVSRMVQKQRLRVHIAGGGIGGLAAAVALRSQGHKVEVRGLRDEHGLCTQVHPKSARSSRLTLPRSSRSRNSTPRLVMRSTVRQTARLPSST